MSTIATFTLSQFEHMIDCGAFAGPNAMRVELIRGVIQAMSPQGAEHAELVGYINAWSHGALASQRFKIRVQSSMEIPQSDTMPEPDVVWVVNKSYARRRPQPDDVLLLIEVADTSLEFDLGQKASLYCQAGICDYWVVDILNRRLHLLRAPGPDGYQDRRTATEIDRVTPLLVDSVSLDVGALFACLD